MLPAELRGSALGRWLVGVVMPGELAEEPEPLIEVLPMNTELRMAVRTPKSGSHTVTTGRPGTGKSQVVAKLVLNAARRGMKAWCVSPRWIRLVSVRRSHLH
jgi:hypothetical protein